MYSLQKFLSRRLLIQILLIMGGLLLVSYFAVRQILHEYIVTRLQHDSESLIASLEYDAQRGWHIGADQMSVIYNRVRSGHYFRVDAKNQSLISRSVFDEAFPLPLRLPDAKGRYVIQGIGEENWLVWFQTVSKSDQVLKVFVAEDINPIQQQLFKYIAYAAMVILLLTGVLIWLQQKTLRRSFEVFEQLRIDLSSIRSGDIDTVAGGMPKEISPLINEIESLVGQLGHRTLRTRRAIGNLAHELKRPMQLLSIQADIGSTQLREPLEEIKRIIDRELRRARISGIKNAGSHFNLKEELPALIEVVEQIYPNIEVRLSLKEIGLLEFDQDDMLELIGNLLDNACKFAQREVCLSVVQKSRWLHIYVEDDGPGFPELPPQDIEDWGVRLDERVSGHGFGLSICKDIVKGYSGEMHFSDSGLGGIKVTVKIPLE